MAFLFLCNNLTGNEKATIQEKFQSKLVHTDNNETGCHLWVGSRDRYGYGIFRMTFRDRRLGLPAHRVAYFIYRDFRRLHRAYHVSHLCHNKLCVNVSHMSLETQKVNKNREGCLLQGSCNGHRGYNRCIFE